MATILCVDDLVFGPATTSRCALKSLVAITKEMLGMIQEP